MSQLTTEDVIKLATAIDYARSEIRKLQSKVQDRKDNLAKMERRLADAIKEKK